MNPLVALVRSTASEGESLGDRTPTPNFVPDAGARIDHPTRSGGVRVPGPGPAGDAGQRLDTPAVLGGPGEGSGYRHIWMESKLAPGMRPVALCGAAYDGREVSPGSNRALPVCERCKALIDVHNAGARLGGRIEVQ
jgi:hypothetical protein